MSAILAPKNVTETSSTDDYYDEEEPFEANIINSTVYIISMALQVATFAINYRVSKFFFGGNHLVIKKKTQIIFHSI